MAYVPLHLPTCSIHSIAIFITFTRREIILSFRKTSFICHDDNNKNCLTKIFAIFRGNFVIPCSKKIWKKLFFRRKIVANAIRYPRQQWNLANQFWHCRSSEASSPYASDNFFTSFYSVSFFESDAAKRVENVPFKQLTNNLIVHFLSFFFF